MSLIRIATLATLVWIMINPRGALLPKMAKRMAVSLLVALAYGAITLAWTASLFHGLHDFVTIALALLTAVALLLVVRDDLRALRWFAVGVLGAGAVQVIIASVEVLTGRHLVPFADDLIAKYGVSSIEVLWGRIAWGTMGNPNDLGGLWLLTTAVFLSMAAYGIVARPVFAMLGWVAVSVSVVIGMTSLADARAYRVGLVLLIGMHVLDRLLTPGRTALRTPVLLMLGWLFLAGALQFRGTVATSTSDGNRLMLIHEGFGDSLLTGGLGRGLGSEKAMIDSGEIPINFHNVVVQLAVEVGLIIATAFLAYLLVLLISWAFVTHSARAIGRERALARATMATALLIYGVTSSGVLESPVYWTFFAVTGAITSVRRESSMQWAPDGMGA